MTGIVDVAPPALESRVLEDARTVLDRRFGAGASVRTREVLADRLSVIVRASAYPGGAGGPASIVLKHLPGCWYGAPAAPGVRREFLEEAAAYEFLEEIEGGFPDRPGLFGRHPAGLLVLEDLGRGDDARRPTGVVSAEVAGALARLHGGTFGHGAAYAAVRARLGLSDAEDNRYESEAATLRRFQRGSETLAEWCALLGVASAGELTALVDPVCREVMRPGSFHVLIHDDLVNARQCVVRDGKTLLLDFENARWAHALRDVAKVLVGKFERHLKTRYMVLGCPGLDAALASMYRRELARAGGPEVDDAAWGAALCDAVLFHTVIQVGTLLELMTWTHVAGEVLPNLRALLRRSALLLDGLATRQGLRRVLALLEARIL